MKKILVLLFTLCFTLSAYAQVGSPVLVGPDSSITRSGNLTSTPIAFTDQDPTPDVSGGSNFITANTVPTTITDFDTALTDGKFISIIVHDAYTDFDFTSSGLVGLTDDYTPPLDSVIGFLYSTVDNQWHLTSSASAGGAGTPGDNYTEIQFNDSGSFGGISSWETDGTRIQPIDGAVMRLKTEVAGESWIIQIFDTLSSTWEDALTFNNGNPPTVTVGSQFGGFSGMNFSTGPVLIEVGTDPTVANAGEIGIDTDDHMFRGFTDAEKGIPFRQLYMSSVFDPDTVADNIAVFHCDATIYPHGCTIVKLNLLLAADAAYTLDFEEWSSADPPIYQNDTHTLTTTASDSIATTSTPTDDTLDAGEFLYMLVPSTVVDWITASILIEAIQGD